MRVRGIAEYEIEDALAHEESRYPSSDDPDNRLVILGTTGDGLRLKVVVSAEDLNYIITVADRDSEE